MQPGQQGVAGLFQFRPLFAQVQFPGGEGPDQVAVGPGPELFALGALEGVALLQVFRTDARDAQGVDAADQDAKGQRRQGRQFQEALPVQFRADEGPVEAHPGQLGQGQGVGGVAHGSGPEGLAFGLGEEAQLPGRVQYELPGAEAGHVVQAVGPGLLLGRPDHGRQPPPDAAEDVARDVPLNAGRQPHGLLALVADALGQLAPHVHFAGAALDFGPLGQGRRERGLPARPVRGQLLP
ncbi:hypothetical protein DSECCO2_352500 [anaerobic digester metagenome]